MKINYKTGTGQLTDQEVLHRAYVAHRTLSVGNSLTKALYYEGEAKKRGYSEEEITAYINNRYLIINNK